MGAEGKVWRPPLDAPAAVAQKRRCGRRRLGLAASVLFFFFFFCWLNREATKDRMAHINSIPETSFGLRLL